MFANILPTYRTRMTDSTHELLMEKAHVQNETCTYGHFSHHTKKILFVHNKRLTVYMMTILKLSIPSLGT